MKLTKIVGLLVVLTALGAGLVLVRQSQETRRGAAYAEVEALFLPESKNVVVGEQFMSTLMLDVKSNKLTGIDLRIKYDQAKLRVRDVGVVLTGSGPGTALFGAESDVLDKTIDEEKGLISLVGISMEEDETKMPIGVINLVKINFEAIASGSAEVTLDESYDNVAAGYNPSSTDQNLEIKTVRGAVYTVAVLAGVTPTVAVPTAANPTIKPTAPPVPTSGLTCVWCGRECVSAKPAGVACPDVMPPEGAKCVAVGTRCKVEYSTTPTVTLPAGTVGCNGRCTTATKCASGLSCVPIWWSGICPPIPAPILEKLNSGIALTVAEKEDLVELCPDSSGVLSSTGGGPVLNRNGESVVTMIGTCRNKNCLTSTNCICGGATPTRRPSPTVTADCPTPPPGCEVSVCATQNYTPKCCPIKCPSPTVTPLPGAVSMVSDWVNLTAKGFRMKIGNETYLVDRASLQVHSDAPEYGKEQLSTLEATWRENNKEMRMYIYFRFNLENKRWVVYDFRTYNGKTPGDWLYYDNTGIYGVYGGVQTPYMSKYLKLVSRDGSGEVVFENVIIKPKFILSASLPTTVAPTVKPTAPPVPTSALTCVWCGRNCISAIPTGTACPDVMPPEGARCIAVGSRCKIEWGVAPTTISTLRPTRAITEVPGQCRVCQAGVAGKRNGNANCDGEIGLTDFEVWRKEAFDDGGIEGKTGNSWEADFNCDQKVNLADFEVWRSSYFK